jgi:hypothetical protein
MALPALEADGNLPVGVHGARLAEVLAVFGSTTAQRLAIGNRLQRLYAIARSTNQLHRFVVFGSFITDKPNPNDVDIVMIMDDNFDLPQFSGDVAIMFNHAAAQTHSGRVYFGVGDLVHSVVNRR